MEPLQVESPRLGAAANPDAADDANAREEIFPPNTPITAVFLQLLPRVAGFMPRTAWVLRLLCKDAASALQEHTTVHLSEPAPPAEFQWRWCGPQSLRSTTFELRETLVLLTARSGVVANLEALIEARGNDLPLLWRPTSEWGPLLGEAAGAGRLEACRWLHEQRGVPLSSSSLGVAAAGGHTELCEWLLERGCDWKVAAVWRAFSGSHVRLAERLLQLRPQGAPFTDQDAVGLVPAAAHGCDLATLQRLHGEHVASCGLDLSEGGMRCVAGSCLSAAAGSPTPDWAAKVEWLEGLGCPRTSLACCAAARCAGGAAARLAWLHGRGFPLSVESARVAAEAGNTEALRYVLASGVQPQRREFARLASKAASAGQLGAMQVLWDAGGWPDGIATCMAAAHGHLHIVAWAAEQLGDSAVLTDGLFSAATRSGDLPLLRWLHERGCPWGDDNGTWAVAAGIGCEEVLEWLAGRGCPMGVMLWLGVAHRLTQC